MLIVTTSKAILSIDNSGNKKVLHKGYDNYYGIAKNNQEYYVAADKKNKDGRFDYRNSKWVHHHSDKSDGDTCIMVFDNNLNYTTSHEPNSISSEIHQIGFGKNQLLCTQTLTDTITIGDGINGKNGKPIPLRSESGIPTELHDDSEIETRDHYHYNSFLFLPHKFFILAHNWHRGSFFMEFNDVFQEPVSITYNFGISSHNLWVDSKHNEIFTLSSKEGTVISNRGFKKEIGGWLRGFASNHDYYGIGVTQDIKDKRLRNTSDGYILKYNKSGELIEKIDTAGYGPIRDILFIED